MSRRPLTTPPDFKAWNDAMVRKYDPEHFHDHASPAVRLVEGARVSRIFRLLAAGPEDRVLEVGCGGGHLLERAGPKAVGLDLAEYLLAKARKRTNGHSALVQGDARVLPFRAGSFDRVYCSEVLEHIPDPVHAMREMQRVLSPWGVAVVSVPNERLINAGKAALRASGLFNMVLRPRRSEYNMPDRMDDEWHLHAYSLKDLLAQIPAGLRVDRVAAVPTRWLPLRYVVRCEPADASAGSEQRRGALAWLLGSPLMFDFHQWFTAADLRVVRQRITDRVPDAERTSVLDVCCGTGNFARVATGSYLGIDLDGRAIAWARRKFRRDPRKRFRIGDATTVELPAKGFEVSLFANGLHHLSAEQALRALRSLSRATRGTVVVVDPAIETRRPLSRLLLRMEQGRFLRPLAEQLALVEAAGLRVSHHEAVHAGLASQRIIVCHPNGGGR